MSNATSAWSGASGDTLVDSQGEYDPHPRVASPDINYGAADDDYLAPVPSPFPSPIMPPVEPVRGGGFSESGDVSDSFLTPAIVLGGRQVQEEGADADADDDFSDNISLSDLSGTTIRSFDTSPSAFMRRICTSTRLQENGTAYLDDLGNYSLAHWLASADMDFGLVTKPVAHGRQTDLDVAIDNAARRALAHEGRTVSLQPGQMLGVAENVRQQLPLEPTSPGYFMRMKVLANFAARCRAAHHFGREQEQAEAKAPCALCAKADGFLMMPGHNAYFLDQIMMPMSDLMSYADMTTLLNMRVMQRAFDEAELGTRTPDDRPYPWEYVRSKPMLDDFEAVLYQAQVRFLVLNTGKIVVDENVMVAAAAKGK